MQRSVLQWFGPTTRRNWVCPRHLGLKAVFRHKPTFASTRKKKTTGCRCIRRFVAGSLQDGARENESYSTGYKKNLSASPALFPIEEVGGSWSSAGTEARCPKASSLVVSDVLPIFISAEGVARTRVEGGAEDGRCISIHYSDNNAPETHPTSSRGFTFLCSFTKGAVSRMAMTATQKNRPDLPT
jgi:hypothetical protein